MTVRELASYFIVDKRQRQKATEAWCFSPFYPTQQTGSLHITEKSGKIVLYDHAAPDKTAADILAEAGLKLKDLHGTPSPVAKKQNEVRKKNKTGARAVIEMIRETEGDGAAEEYEKALFELQNEVKYFIRVPVVFFKYSPEIVYLYMFLKARANLSGRSRNAYPKGRNGSPVTVRKGQCIAGVRHELPLRLQESAAWKEAGEREAYWTYKRVESRLAKLEKDGFIYRQPIDGKCTLITFTDLAEQETLDAIENAKKVHVSK